MGDVRIQPYDPAYARETMAFVLATQHAAYGFRTGPADLPDLGDVQGVYRRPGGAFWLAVRAGGAPGAAGDDHVEMPVRAGATRAGADRAAVVGTIGIQRVTEDGGVLRRFYVDEALRGRHVGSRLFAALAAFCDEAGITRIVLDTPVVATRAHEFYRRHGFRVITPAELPFPYAYHDRPSLIFLRETPRG